MRGLSRMEFQVFSGLRFLENDFSCMKIDEREGTKHFQTTINGQMAQPTEEGKQELASSDHFKCPKPARSVSQPSPTSSSIQAGKSQRWDCSFPRLFIPSVNLTLSD